MLISSIAPLAALRILCGIWFVPHCIGKICHIGPASQAFDQVGFRPGRLFVFITIAFELLAGSGLVLGIHKELAAALAVVVLTGAGYAVVKINGLNWRWQRQGPEYVLFWAIACVISVLG